MTRHVDLFIIFYNSRALVPGLFQSLCAFSVPVTAYFLDNGSRDGTADLLADLAPALPFPAYVLRSAHNNGFARGMNLLAKQSRADFIFLLNPDTEIQTGCLEALLARIQSDPAIGMCEARQIPREHPKAYDPATGETTWCSGAACLVRRHSFEQAGGFEERLYFMYCEDVDLSWRFWQNGWKCVYVPEASVKHFTQDLLPGKRRTRENYFTFRNSLFLYYRFATARDRPMLWRFLRSRFFSGKYSLRSRILFTIALVDYIRYIPYLLQKESDRRDRAHPWIRLEETSLSK